jgi:hypothetical protein
VTPQFGASLADFSRVIIYDHNIFIVQATDYCLVKEEKKPIIGAGLSTLLPVAQIEK